jgi:hypothetical protein
MSSRRSPRRVTTRSWCFRACNRASEVPRCCEVRHSDARLELDVADHQLERAENYLANTRERTGPAVELHNRAVTAQREAHDELRTCDAVDRLDAMTPSAGEQRMRMRALEVWKQWAEGHPVPDRSLRTVAAVLNQRAGLQRQLSASLPDDIQQPVRGPRPTAERDPIATRSSGPELGIER